MTTENEKIKKQVMRMPIWLLKEDIPEDDELVWVSNEDLERAFDKALSLKDEARNSEMTPSDTPCPKGQGITRRE